jgi:hypothetical protein
VDTIGGGKKQSRQYRFPHPPVPHAQTSLLQSQRLPASAVAYPSARQFDYKASQVSSSDSQYYAARIREGVVGGGLDTLSMAAGADGLASTADDTTDGSAEAAVPSADPDTMEAKKGLNKWGAFDSLSGSGTGTFGFGPLLFHHVDETPRDPYDTTNMMLNDPISFNPMSAISWAKLDDGPDSADELDGDRSSTAQQSDSAAAAVGTSGSRQGGSSSHAGYVDSPASTPASPRHGSGASYTSDVSGSRTSSVAGSSVGNISRTFSDTSLVSPDTDRSTTGIPPAFRPSPPSSRTPHPPSGHQQQQKQYGSQPEVPVQYRTHQPQQQANPAQNPHRAAANQQPFPEMTDFLLCLGPYCSARFPTEQELAAHYRAEHAFTCSWPSCSATSFTSSNALAWHINVDHYLVCPMPGCCGLAFGSKTLLDRHLKVSCIDLSDT